MRCHPDAAPEYLDGEGEGSAVARLVHRSCRQESRRIILSTLFAERVGLHPKSEATLEIDVTCDITAE
jgi:hypothetical protein